MSCKEIKGASTACKQVLAYRPLAQTQPWVGHFKDKPLIPHIDVTGVLGPHKKKQEQIRTVTVAVKSPYK